MGNAWDSPDEIRDDFDTLDNHRDLFAIGVMTIDLYTNVQAVIVAVQERPFEPRFSCVCSLDRFEYSDTLFLA